MSPSDETQNGLSTLRKRKFCSQVQHSFKFPFRAKVRGHSGQQGVMEALPFAPGFGFDAESVGKIALAAVATLKG
jgi:hypothetical protein